MDRQGYPASYYVATANGLEPRPRLEGRESCDVAVVGGGYCGLSTALHLAERGYRVALLESHRIAWGASGRNGGQVNSGLRIGPCDLLRRFGREQARRLWALAEEAKATVRERIARHAIACDLRPGVLMGAVAREDLAWMRADVDCLEEELGYRHARLLNREATAAEVASPLYHGGILDRGAAHLHPLNYALGLAAAASAAGARLFEETRVTRIHEAGADARLVAASGEVRAGQVVLCCNAYLDRLEPRLAGHIMPIANYILATEPLDEPAARALIPGGIAVHDSKFVVNYYRLTADHRLLYGGGETYSTRLREDPVPLVRRHMLRTFPQLAHRRVDYAWGGHIAITVNRLPHFGRIGGKLWFAHGFSGQGIALATLAGKLIAEAVSGTAERFDLMARLPHRRFPGGTLLRKPALALAMLYYGLRDRL